MNIQLILEKSLKTESKYFNTSKPNQDERDNNLKL